MGVFIKPSIASNPMVSPTGAQINVKRVAINVIGPVQPLLLRGWKLLAADPLEMCQSAANGKVPASNGFVNVQLYITQFALP